MEQLPKRKDIINYGQWIQPTLPGTFWSHWHEADDLKTITLQQGMHPLIFLNGHSINLKQDVTTMADIIKKVTATSLGTKQYTRAIEKLGQRYKQEHLAVLKKDKKPSVYIPTLFLSYKNAVGLWWFMIPLSTELEKYIRQQWPKVSNEELFYATRPIKLLLLELQQKSIAQIARKVQKAFPNLKAHHLSIAKVKTHPVIWKAVQNHTEQFVWYGTHHWGGTAYTTAECLKEVQDFLKNSRRKSISTHQKSTIPKAIAQLAGTINYWRTHMAELTSKVVFLSRPVLIKLAKQWNLSYEDLTYLSHTEILNNLGTNSLSATLRQAITQRKAGYGCILDNKNNEHIYTGSKLKALLQSLVETEIVKSDTVTGMVASIGPEVKAKAKIIMSPQDFAKFNKGDVLITNETTPDFVPLMKIASAVVTDIGGITSHAAIISRELQMPCIVGTKIATKIFKDNMRVKVDTQKGQVIILK